jgi:hypothetical protein
MKRRTLVAISTAVSCVLAACGGSDSNPNGSPTSADLPTVTPILVDELIARSADTPVPVTGMLHATGGVVRLCGAILESFPPQCGEPSVVLDGVDISSVDGATTEGDVTWNESVVLLVKRVSAERYEVVDA